MVRLRKIIFVFFVGSLYPCHKKRPKRIMVCRKSSLENELHSIAVKESKAEGVIDFYAVRVRQDFTDTLSACEVEYWRAKHDSLVMQEKDIKDQLAKMPRNKTPIEECIAKITTKRMPHKKKKRGCC